MSETEKDERGHGWSILLAAILFLLGEKSLTIAKFGLLVYDGGESKSTAAFEISLAGLAIGTAAVIFLSVLFRNIAKQDAVAIVTGLVVATLAALFNIGEAIWLEPVSDDLKVPFQALFFYALWLLLLPVPLLASMGINGMVDGRPLKLIATIALALIIAAAGGAAFRWLSGYFLFTAFPQEGVTNRELAYDRLQFEPDMLIMLGATWIAATFLPRCGWGWRLAYVVFAPICGYAYAALLSGSGVDRALAYAALSASAILPCLLLWPSAGWPNRSRMLVIAVSTGVCCFLSMLVGFASAMDVSGAEKIALSLLQGLAGMVLVLCAVVAFAASKKWLKWQLFP